MSLESFLQEYESRTELDPFSPTERVYTPGVGDFRRTTPICSFVLDPADNAVCLVSMRSHVRGEGQGSQAFAWLCDLADRHVVTMHATLAPVGPEPRLEVEQLRAWFTRYGFQCIGNDASRSPCPITRYIYPAEAGLFLMQGIDGERHEPTTRLVNSFHEAGHTIIAWHIGVHIEYATLTGTLEFQGHVSTEELSAHQAGLIARGGLLAEVLAFGGDRSSEAEHDMGRAFHDVVRMRVGDRDCDCAPDAALAHAEEAVEIIEMRVRELEAVAKELFRCGTLTGEGIRNLLGQP